MFVQVGDRAGRGHVNPVRKLPDVYPDGVSTFEIQVPNGWSNLEICWHARSSKAAVTSEDMNVRFNRESTGNTYNTNVLYNNAATTAASAQVMAANEGTIANLPAATATASYFSGGTVRISNYYSPFAFKVATCSQGGAIGNASNNSIDRHWEVVWANLSAINVVTFFLAAGTFVKGSRFSPYLFK